ncbi:J domain-containing protein [Agarivorans sp. MS3-6]
MTTHFQLFALDDNATQQQIKTRYKQLLVRCHPDKGGSSALVVLIRNSYQHLMSGQGLQAANFDNNIATAAEVRSLKKVIHQQQFHIQKLAISMGEGAHTKQLTFTRAMIWSPIISVAVLIVVLMFWSWERPAKEHLLTQPQTKAASAPSSLTTTALQNQDQLYANWELKQKLRLSKARLQYVETDFYQSRQIIEQLLSDENRHLLSNVQLQFLEQQKIHPLSDNKTTSDAQ